MADRQWNPITPKPWIADAISQRRAEEFVKTHGEYFAHMYARVHGYSREGVVDVEFPDLVRAATVVALLKMEDIASTRDAGVKFTGSVVIQFDTSKLTA